MAGFQDSANVAGFVLQPSVGGIIGDGQTATSAATSRHWAQEQDWDAHKDLIEHLYCELGLPLKQVAGKLQAKHDFHATSAAQKSPRARVPLTW